MPSAKRYDDGVGGDGVTNDWCEILHGEMGQVNESYGGCPWLKKSRQNRLYIY